MFTSNYRLIFGLILIIISIIFALYIYIKATKNKDKDVKYNYIFSIILAIIGALISFVQNTDKPDSPVIESTSLPSEVSTIEPSSETTFLITTTAPTTLETTSVISTNPPIKSNEIPLNFTIEGQEIRRSFTAPTSGKYRFDFIIDDVTCNYEIRLYDSKNNLLFDSYYSTEEHGESYRLTKGEEYRIIVTQEEGFTTGKIEIGVPEEEKLLNIK